MEKKTPPSLLILGWLASVFISFGTVFKLMHWPGANVMLILGTVFFLLFYLPLWLTTEFQKGRKLVLIYQFIVLFVSSATFLIKTLHWPYSGVLYNIWFSATLLIILPISLVQLFRAGSKTPQQFHLIIVYFFLGSLIIGGISGSASRVYSMANSFSKNTTNITSSIERLKVKNTQLYAAFGGIPDKASNPFYEKAIKLKKLTDSTERYIRNFRKHIISLNENVSEEEADSMSVSDMRNITGYEATTDEICGADEYKPRSGKFSGLELKSVIDIYRDSIIKFVDGENRNFIKAGINLDTEPIIDEDGESKDWVSSTFRNVSISVALLSLENLKHEIKNAETQVLSDLLNSTKQTSGSLAAKVAELGTKLESEKKQREIENLKNERELSQANLNAKNLELDVQRKTIVWFVAGLMACSVMIFFIIRSNMIRKKINKELAEQKQLIETKNKEITDSINYARRIQSAILPPVDLICSTLQDAFVLYKPKDVVSGDFYGFFRRDDYVIMAIADCTGHGVPGAFMSMIGNEQLNKIITEKGITTPSDVLNELHSGVRKALKQDRAEGETRDGMDIALCKYYLKERKLEYAGAMRPLWLLRNGALTEIRADKQPIGGLDADYRKPFTNHAVDLNENDCIYMFTDGYADQFGGEKGKKFMLKNFERLLTEIANLPMQQQMTMINEKFEAWKGSHEQVDDVLVAGIRV